MKRKGRTQDCVFPPALPSNSSMNMWHSADALIHAKGRKAELHRVWHADRKQVMGCALFRSSASNVVKFPEELKLGEAVCLFTTSLTRDWSEGVHWWGFFFCLPAVSLVSHHLPKTCQTSYLDYCHLSMNERTKYKFIPNHSYIYSKHIILVSRSLSSVLGILGMRRECTLDGIPTSIFLGMWEGTGLQSGSRVYPGCPEKGNIPWITWHHTPWPIHTLGHTQGQFILGNSICFW